MRATHYLGWTLLCLLALGCNSAKWGKSGNSRGGSGANTTQDPFMLSSRDGNTPKDLVNGILAGYALDRWRNPMSEATIEIVDLNDPPKKARITTTTDRAGQYKFEGLNPTHQYQLVARTRDGNRQLVGTVLGSPPNPRLPIYLTEDLAGSDPRSASKEEDGKTSQVKDRANSIASPAATLSPPIKTPPESEPTPGSVPTNSLPGTPVPDRVPDRSRTTQDGYLRNPIVTIPGPATSPAPVLPPPPTRPGATPPPTNPTSDGPQASFGTPSGPSVELPAVSVTTPSCQLTGKRLQNFSLLDIQGSPWIFTRDRDRNARLVLLDFWSTQCTPCLAWMPTLNNVQREFGPSGLQIIGITHEQGTTAEAATRLQNARMLRHIQYTTVLSGTTPGPCPVLSNFQVSALPTMVLLDQTGTIVWRKTGGFTEQAKAELEFEIRKHLSAR